jgi:hypothetical protein
VGGQSVVADDVEEDVLVADDEESDVPDDPDEEAPSAAEDEPVLDEEDPFESVL